MAHDVSSVVMFIIVSKERKQTPLLVPKFLVTDGLLIQDTLIKMRKTKIWKLENDFYNFAAKHFQSVKKVAMEQKSQGREFYNFEKVRPKSK